MDEKIGRDATSRGSWFAAGVAVVFAAFAALSWAGVALEKKDAPTLVLMALGSAGLFAFGRVMLRLLERSGPAR